jgi:beta-phosphoglucomutase-like phosphatase (HAD superfamily)
MPWSALIEPWRVVHLVMSATPAAVLFDVDGTLVDSNYLHAVCWWEAFTQAGHDVPMACIALLSGGISRAELLAAGAAEVYEGPAELLAALPESLLAHQNTAPVRRFDEMR